jgi:hypothetical protein
MNLLFKLGFYPFFSFNEGDFYYIVGNRIEAYKELKRIYSYGIKGDFIGACKIDKYLFILSQSELTKFDYLNGKFLSKINDNFSSLGCNGNRLLLSKDTIYYIMNTDLKILDSLKGKSTPLNGFIILSDTTFKLLKIISIDNMDTLIIRNFEGFIPYFAKRDSIFSIVAGFSKRNNFYIYFFENRNLRWYQKISVKIIISDIIFNLKDRTILIYGSSNKSFYLNLKDFSGEDIWVYNPRVLGVYFLDEAFRKVYLINNKIYAWGYSIREGEKRGVIKIFDYNSGNLLLDWVSQNELEDMLDFISFNNHFYTIALSKKFIGFYRVKINSAN